MASHKAGESVAATINAGCFGGALLVDRCSSGGAELGGLKQKPISNPSGMLVGSFSPDSAFMV